MTRDRQCSRILTSFAIVLCACLLVHTLPASQDRASLVRGDAPPLLRRARAEGLESRLFRPCHRFPAACAEGVGAMVLRGGGQPRKGYTKGRVREESDSGLGGSSDGGSSAESSGWDKHQKSKAKGSRAVRLPREESDESGGGASSGESEEVSKSGRSRSDEPDKDGSDSSDMGTSSSSAESDRGKKKGQASGSREKGQTSDSERGSARPSSRGMKGDASRGARESDSSDTDDINADKQSSSDEEEAMSKSLSERGAESLSERGAEAAEGQSPDHKSAGAHAGESARVRAWAAKTAAAAPGVDLPKGDAEGPEGVDSGGVFDPRWLGASMTIQEGGRVILKDNYTWASEQSIGSPKEDWFEKDRITHKIDRVPTFCVFGNASDDLEVVDYHVRIREKVGGNFFIGLLEIPFYPIQQWAYQLKTNAWMLADGGTIWRTGEGLGENASGEGWELDRALAQQAGTEHLTEKLRRSMHEDVPQVKTPGCWAYGENSVVSMRHDRTARTVTFMAHLAPPFTLHNVSNSARPFINILHQGDSAAIITPEHAFEIRRVAKLKKRGPEDEDYWVWDYERWRPGDAGVVVDEMAEGGWRIDEKKPNKWYPNYDPTDGRSPVPGVGLLEYMCRRNNYLAQVRDKRQKERSRAMLKAIEKGQPLPEDWKDRKGKATGENKVVKAGKVAVEQEGGEQVEEAERILKELMHAESSASERESD
ncbi:hypothetical protein T484DRAFT_3107545 [Baffinella frigidus]|nr:hypothetical protein T484DRAFT_3107545 [Cryptophyta sp. CCMP2293]